MKVSFDNYGKLYVIEYDPSHPGGWGTAAKTTEGWYLMTRAGRVIKNNGKLGKAIVKAVEDYAAQRVKS